MAVLLGELLLQLLQVNQSYRECKLMCDMADELVHFTSASDKQNDGKAL